MAALGLEKGGALPRWTAPIQHWWQDPNDFSFMQDAVELCAAELHELCSGLAGSLGGVSIVWQANDLTQDSLLLPTSGQTGRCVCGERGTLCKIHLSLCCEAV